MKHYEFRDVLIFKGYVDTQTGIEAVEKLLQNFCDKNNLYRKSIEELEQIFTILDAPSVKRRIGVYLKFMAREKTKDDEETERIEYMINNL